MQEKDIWEGLLKKILSALLENTLNMVYAISSSSGKQIFISFIREHFKHGICDIFFFRQTNVSVVRVILNKKNFLYEF